MNRPLMKIRRFYPRQVLTALRDRSVRTLTRAQRHALTFFMMRSRHYGCVITIQDDGVVRVLGTPGLIVQSGPMKAPQEGSQSGSGRFTIFPTGTPAGDIVEALKRLYAPLGLRTFQPGLMRFTDDQLRIDQGITSHVLIHGNGTLVIGPETSNEASKEAP